MLKNFIYVSIYTLYKTKLLQKVKVKNSTMKKIILICKYQHK